MIFYYLLFAFLVLVSAGPRATYRVRFFAVAIVLFAVAALRGEGVDRDYAGYLEYFNDIQSSGFSNVEVSFLAIVKALQAIDANPTWLFVAYSAIGMSIMSVAIWRLTTLAMTSLLIFYSNYFFLWEMTQIRVAVSGALLLLAVPAIERKEPLKFFALWLIAVTFHYSALPMIGLYLLSRAKLGGGLHLYALPFIALSFYAFFNVADLIGFSPIALIELKIQSYQAHVESTDSVFNAVFFARCAFAYFLLYNADLLADRNRYFGILIQMYFLGLFVHIAFASIPGIASRLSEMLLVTEVLLFPMLIHLFRNRALGYGLAVCAALIFMAFVLHYTGLVQPYELNPVLVSGRIS